MINMTTQQKTVIPRKRGPAPTGKGTPVMVRLPTDLLKALDRSRGDAVVAPTRPEAVRRALTDWLRERGYLKEISPS
jgi:hypothetical protein